MTLRDQGFRFVKRGATKMMEPAGEYPAITTEFINKHVHPSQAAKLCRADWSGKDESSVETVHPEVIKLLHAYVDADRAMRAQADSQPALPEITAEDRSFLHDNPNTDDIVKWVQHYASAAVASDRAARAPANSELEDAAPQAMLSPQVSVSENTLRWWRELATANPQDLVPRIDAHLDAARKQGDAA